MVRSSDARYDPAGGDSPKGELEFETEPKVPASKADNGFWMFDGPRFGHGARTGVLNRTGPSHRSVRTVKWQAGNIDPTVVVR